MKRVLFWMLVVTMGFAFTFPSASFSMETHNSSAKASSVATYSKTENVNDGNIFTYYSSAEHSDAAHTEWIQVDLGTKQYEINHVRLYPREYGYGFPQTFSIQYSDNGKKWKQAPGASFTNYENPAWDQVEVHFTKPVNARYIRLHATKLGVNESEKFALQIAELTIAQHTEKSDHRVTPVSVDASSEANKHNKLFVVNNHRGDYWSSEIHSSADNNESITLNYDKKYMVNSFDITPRPGGWGFPKDFSIQYSPDGENFKTIPGQQYTDYPNPRAKKQTFQFEPIKAKAIRVVATELGKTNKKGYALQLSEMVAQSSVPFQTDMNGAFDRIWNEMWQQFGAVDDGTESVYKFGNEPSYFEWIARKILWSNEEAYKNELKNKIRDFPIGNDGYIWSWKTQPRWPSGNSYHYGNNPKYILAAWRVAVWDDDSFLDVVDQDTNSFLNYEGNMDRNSPPMLEEGQTLGQSFTIDKPFTSVGGEFPTYGTSGSGVTLSLYKDGPEGELITQKDFTNVSDNAWVHLDFEEALPAGTYYLEQSNPIGTMAWWSHTDDVYDGGSAYVNGEPIEGDRAFRIAVGGNAAEDISEGMTVWEKAQKAMEYMEEVQNGKNGLLIIDNGENDGTPSGHASNYWDNLKMGYKEPYSNVYFYAATQAMSELWSIKGNEDKAAYYARLADKIKEQFNQAFWDDELKRYVSTVDINGETWDFGLTFLNLEALAYGLASEEQGEDIIDWLDGKREIANERSTGEDIYYYKIAPRANTIPIESTGSPYWWNDVGGAIPVTGSGGWDEHLENGGFIFYTEYYDIIARLKYKDIDNAFDRMKLIANEYAVDDLRRDPLNSYGASWRIGVVGEFPESGLVPAAFVYTITGVDATKDGLLIAPNIPSDITTASVTDLTYQNREYDIQVWDDKVVLESMNKSTDTLALTIGNLKKNSTYTLITTKIDTGSTTEQVIVTDGDGKLQLTEELTGATKLIIKKKN